MHTVRLNIDDNIFDTVMNFLKLLPQNQLEIDYQDEDSEDAKFAKIIEQSDTNETVSEDEIFKVLDIIK